MDFYIGQIFYDEYDFEVLGWIDEHPNTYIKEISPEGNRRRFQLVEEIFSDEELKERELERAKDARGISVSRITVEVDGLLFNGDEKAQERMSRAVSTARSRADRLYNKAIAEWLADQPEGTLVDVSQSGIVKDDYMTYETTWVLADSTYTTVTISQLSEACELAWQMQTELWIVPYEDK